MICRQIAHLTAYTNKCQLAICQKLQRHFNDANIILNLPAMTNRTEGKDEQRFASGVDKSRVDKSLPTHLFYISEKNFFGKLQKIKT